MCGRATYKLNWEEIVAVHRLTLGQPAVNTGTTIDTIVGPDDRRELVRMRWGLIPSWWSKPLKEMKLATFNARSETVATKPMFRSAFKRSRLAKRPRKSIDNPPPAHPNWRQPQQL